MIGASNICSLLRRTYFFFSAVDVGYVQAWKYRDRFYLDCRRVDGAYYRGENFGVSYIVPVCKRYFEALLNGEDLMDVI